MRNKKVLLGVFILLFMFLININVSAGCSISISAPKTASVGSTFKVSATVPSNSGSWEYTLSYDSSKVKLVSGTLKVVGVYGDTRTSTYTFKSLTEGSASFKAVNGSIYDYDSVSECYSGSGTATVNMGESASNNTKDDKNYSSDNTLKSLEIKGITLSPEFNKNTYSYKAAAEAETEKVEIDAKANDSKAKVAGTGLIEVKEGVNEIKVVVTAEDGSKKEYLIELTVQEQEPIEAKVGNKNYTVVTKEDEIEGVPESFEKTTVSLDNRNVIAFENKTLKMLLVALKDEKGNVKLFIYDKSKLKYSPFNYSSEFNLLILDNNNVKLPYGFEKTTAKFNDEDITAYKYIIDKNKVFYLVYATNLSSNKEGLYVFNSKDNTFIKYDDINKSKDTLIEYETLAFIGLSLLIILVFMLKILKKLFTSRNKKIRKLTKKLEKLKSKQSKDIFDDEQEDEEENEEPVITKVEDDKKVPKKTRKEKRKELMDAKKLLDKDKTSIRRISLEPNDLDDYDEF